MGRSLQILGCWLLAGKALFCMAGEDWPRFRGPNGAAVSTATGLPVKWDEQTNLAWKKPLPGPGSSSPIVLGDRIFLTAYSGYGTDRRAPGEKKQLVRHLLCLNLSDGNVRWSKAIPTDASEDTYSGFIRDHGYATSTPVTDGKRVFVMFGKMGLLAFDLEGNELWRKSVGTGSAMNGWGSGSSPVLYKNLVIVNAAAESKSLVALYQDSGKEAWKSPADALHGSWSTPVLVQAPSGKMEMVLSAPYEVWGFDPDNGEFLWFAQGVQDRTICGSLLAREGVVYALGGRSGSAVAIRAGGKDEVTKTHTLWKKSVTSYVPSPVLEGERIWSVNERGILTCLKVKDGETVYTKRLPDAGGVYASPVVGDGKLYIVTRQNGTFVISSDAGGAVLATNKFEDETDFNASPAIVEGKILLRSNRFLYCVAEGTKK